MIHAFKQIRLNGSSVLVTGAGVLQVGSESVVYRSQTGSFVDSAHTGTFITSSQTGLFYPISNPSGFITGLSTGSFITVNQTGSFVTTSQTGLFVAQTTQQTFATIVATGVDFQFISFASNFPTTPKVYSTIEVTGDTMYAVNVRGRTISGYTALFSDTIQESGVVVHTFASIN